MKISVAFKDFKEQIQLPLLKNAIFLIMTSGITSILGFLFWIVVARFYSASDVGLAAAMISAAGLLATFSKLGFDFSIPRFLPTAEDKKGIINSALTTAGIFSLITGSVFVIGLGWWSPALVFIQKDTGFTLSFIFFSLVFVMSTLLNSVFIGLRQGKYSLFQSAITAVSKLPLPLLLVASGALGIYLSWGLAGMLASVVTIVYFLPRLITKYLPLPSIKTGVLRPMFFFSSGNYVAEVLDSAPGLLLPLIVVNLLTKEMSAYFFIAWSVANVLFTVPVAVCSSLMVEGAYSPQRMRQDVWRVIRFTLLILVPSVLIIFIFGEKILLLFGRDYSQSGGELLWILALSSLPYALVRIYVTVKRIQMKTRPIIIMYAFVSVSTMVLCYLLIPEFGFRSIGLTWVGVQLIMALIAGWLLMKKDFGRTSELGKAVPPEAWDEKQLLTRCEGYDEFRAGEVDPSYQKTLNLMEPQPGRNYLDIGCGRGEMVRVLAKITPNAVGVDYSPAAIKISQGIPGGGSFVRGDATALPFKDEVFDAVTMLGFIECLTREDLGKCLQEVKRILTSEGRLILATPNEHGVAFFNFLDKIASFMLGRRRDSQAYSWYGSGLVRSSYNYFSLKKVVKQNGFKARVWFDVPETGRMPRIVYRMLFFTSPLYCIAEKAGARRKENANHNF